MLFGLICLLVETDKQNHVEFSFSFWSLKGKVAWKGKFPEHPLHSARQNYFFWQVLMYLNESTNGFFYKSLSLPLSLSSGLT